MEFKDLFDEKKNDGQYNYVTDCQMNQTWNCSPLVH